MALRLRRLAAQERARIAALAADPSCPLRLRQRATILTLADQGARAPAIARAVGVSEATVRLWLKRFMTYGLNGLLDQPRPGRAPLFGRDQRRLLASVALALPTNLGLHQTHWTLDLLAAHVHDAYGISISRTHLAMLLRGEGLAWSPAERCWRQTAQQPLALQQPSVRHAPRRVLHPRRAGRFAGSPRQPR